MNIGVFLQYVHSLGHSNELLLTIQGMNFLFLLLSNDISILVSDRALWVQNESMWGDFCKWGQMSHYCVADWWECGRANGRWHTKWFHLSFILYLNRNVQRIHNLPDHEWQEIDSQEHPNCCVEFPWLQVLLCEFEQRHTHTHTKPSLSRGPWGSP